MTAHKGLNQHVAPGRCMVVGCEGKAIYRTTKSQARGYCAAHKHLAVERMQATVANSHRLDDWLGPDYDRRHE